MNPTINKISAPFSFIFFFFFCPHIERKENRRKGFNLYTCSANYLHCRCFSLRRLRLTANRAEKTKANKQARLFFSGTGNEGKKRNVKEACSLFSRRRNKGEEKKCNYRLVLNYCTRNDRTEFRYS